MKFQTTHYHLDLLKDTERVSAFFEAIDNYSGNTNLAYDLGCGSGILSYFLRDKFDEITTDKNGYASLKITFPSKRYIVKATYGNLKVSKAVIVKTVISAKNISPKKSAKSIKIKVTLKKVNKKYLKNKKVYLKFNKKTFKAKTNKKGVVTFTIKKNVYSKLKVGKKYAYQVIYIKDKVTKSIKFKK